MNFLQRIFLLLLILFFIHLIPEKVIYSFKFPLLGEDYLQRDIFLYSIKAIASTYLLSILSVFTAVILIVSYIGLLLVYNNRTILNLFFVFSSLFSFPFLLIAMVVLFFFNNLGVLFLLLTVIAFSRLFKILEGAILEFPTLRHIKFFYLVSNSLRKTLLYTILPEFLKRYEKVLALEILEISYIFAMLNMLGFGISTQFTSIGFLIYEYLNIGDFTILLKILIVYLFSNLLILRTL